MSTAINHAAAMKRLEALFNDVKLDRKSPPPEIHVQVETKPSTKCDVHGQKNNNGRRGSLGSVLHITNRRDSLGNVISQKKEPNYHTTGYFGGGVGPRRESMPALNAYNNLTNNYYRYLIDDLTEFLPNESFYGL